MGSRVKLFRWFSLVGAALILGLLVGLYAIAGKSMADHPGSGDFLTFYLSSVRLRYAEPVYWPAPDAKSFATECAKPGYVLDPSLTTTSRGLDFVRVAPCRHPNLNPPFVVALTAPLAYLDYSYAWWIWAGLSLGSAFMAFRIMRREVFLPDVETMPGLMLLAGYFLYYPTIVCLMIAQVTFLVMLPMTLGWRALRRRENGMAGAWLGLAASMKPFLGLFLVGLVVQKNWRSAWAMLLVVGLSGLFGAAFLGFDAYTAYLDCLAQVNWQAVSWNASLSGFFSRIFGGSLNEPWIDVPLLARTLTLATSLIVLALYGQILVQAHRLPKEEGADILLSATIPAMLLLSPLGWMYYFPMLVFTVLALWRNRSAFAQQRLFYWGFVAMIGLSGMPSELVPSTSMNEPLQWFGTAGIYFYTLIIALLMTRAMVRRLAGQVTVNLGQ